MKFNQEFCLMVSKDLICVNLSSFLFICLILAPKSTPQEGKLLSANIIFEFFVFLLKSLLSLEQ